MANSTLDAIRKKVRRLTRSPSESQITTAEIDEYVNTFVLYDFPEELRLFTLRTTLTFYTEPNIDTYLSSTTPELIDFKDQYINVHNPVYIAGRKVPLFQSREQFYNLYPLTNSLQDVATGDGVTTLFAGTLSTVPVLRNNVTFSAIDINDNGLAAYDDGIGNFLNDGVGTIDYETGAWSITFAVAPKASTAIQAQVIHYQPNLPTSILYHENQFVVRPVPDRPYAVNMEVDRQPSELLIAGDTPELDQWWQYIALGTAKKVFEDRSDMDSVKLIMPELKRQEILVLRRTIVQQTKERVATIYTDGVNNGYDNNGFGNNRF